MGSGLKIWAVVGPGRKTSGIVGPEIQQMEMHSTGMRVLFS